MPYARKRRRRRRVTAFIAQQGYAGSARSPTKRPDKKKPDKKKPRRPHRKPRRKIPIRIKIRRKNKTRDPLENPYSLIHDPYKYIMWNHEHAPGPAQAMRKLPIPELPEFEVPSIEKAFSNVWKLLKNLPKL